MPTATGTGLRLATDEEVLKDLLINPMDFWHSLPLGVPVEVASAAARMLWGAPGSSPNGGEELWRLRTVDVDSFPVYLSVEPIATCLLFSSVNCPEREIGDSIAANVAGFLRESDHD